MTLNSKQFEDLFGKKLSKTKSLTLEETGTLLQTVTESAIAKVDELYGDYVDVKVEMNLNGKVEKIVDDYENYNYRKDSYPKLKVPKGEIHSPSVKVTVTYSGALKRSSWDNAEYYFSIKSYESDSLSHWRGTRVECDTYEEAVKDLPNQEIDGFTINFNDGVQEKSIGYGSRSMTNEIEKKVKVRYIPKMQELFDTISKNIVKSMTEDVERLDEIDANRADNIIEANWKQSFETSDGKKSLTMDSATKIYSDMDKGLSLIGKHLDAKTKKMLKSKVDEYKAIRNDIEQQIGEMDFEETIELAKKYENEVEED